MKKRKVWKGISGVLCFVVSIGVIYYVLGLKDGSIYTKSYTKQFDEPVIDSTFGLTMTDSYENLMGRVMKLSGVILGALDEEKGLYVLQEGENATEESVVIIKNNTDIPMDRGDTVEVNGFYAGRKKVSLDNGVNTSAVVVDTLIAVEIDADELIYRPAKERRTGEISLNIKSDRDENTGILADVSHIDKYKNYNLMNFGVIKFGEGMCIIRSLKVEKYSGDKLLEIEKIELLNHNITSENDKSIDVSSRCDFEVTKVKIILEYTGLDGEKVRTSTVEVEFPKEVIR